MNRAAVVQTKMLTLPARKHVRLSGRDSLMQRMDDDADAGDDDDVEDDADYDDLWGGVKASHSKMD